MVSLIVTEIPESRAIRSLAAAWSVRQWRASFPSDTAQWYLNLYKSGDFSKKLPVTVAAIINGNLVGVGSLVADDELPGASEPGPWLAAVYVTPSFRGKGAGSKIVQELLDHAFLLGYREVFCYTETKRDWYQKMGWQLVREALLAKHEVAVLKYTLR